MFVGTGPVGGWFVGIVYTVRFATELALFAAVAFGGYRIGDGHLGSPVIGTLLGSVAITIAIGCWARWIAPRAAQRLDDPLRFGTEMALFVWAAAALVAVAWTAVAIAFGVAAVAAAVAIRWTGEPTPEHLDPDSGSPVR